MMAQPRQSGPSFPALARGKSFSLLLLAAFLLVPQWIACRSAEKPATGTAAVLLPVQDDPTVSFLVWFDVGSQDDPAGKEGLAYLTGSLLAEGATTANTYEQILEKLYPLASSYSVRVDKEMTTLAGRTHRDNLEAFFALFTDAYLEPAFAAADFERLRQNQLNALEKNLRYASDEELGKAALTSFVFAGTAYAHPVLGTVAGLGAITLDDVRAFYAAHYSRDHAVVALGGGYDDSLRQRFEATLDGLPEGATTAAPSPDAAPAAWTGRRVLLVDKPDADASISYGSPLSVHRGERDFYALWIANAWLGEHRSSVGRLFQVIREARGLNYGDYSYIEAFPQGGHRMVPPANVARHHQLFEVWIRTLPNEQALFALRASLRTLAQLIENGLTEEQFELCRSYLRKYHLHYAEATETRLRYRVDDRFFGIDDPGHLARFGDLMASLTRDEVNAAIRRHLSLDTLKIAIVTGQAEALRDAMIADAPSPIEYPSPKPQEIVDEDRSIAAYPLGIAADAVTIVPVDEIFGR